jgi:hypothetical protein
MTLLLNDPKIVVPTWPTVYSAMDVIANRTSPEHYDRGGAFTFYDHLVNFGQDHDARLCLDALKADFVYRPGTSVLFTGKDRKVFKHSVPLWSGGERMVIVHYSKDDVHYRLDVERPLLPNQANWCTRYSQIE